MRGSEGSHDETGCEGSHVVRGRVEPHGVAGSFTHMEGTCWSVCVRVAQRGRGRVGVCVRVAQK